MPASHLGRRLEALIDDDLDGDQRDRVLVHLAKCEDCRGEAVALRTLKRRMNALDETEADSALTRRLVGLAALSAGLEGQSEATDLSGGPRPRRVSLSAKGIASLAAFLMPAAEQSRYIEEFSSELFDFAQGGAGRLQVLLYAFRLLAVAIPVRAAVQSPRRRGAAP